MRTLHQVGYKSMVGIHVIQGQRLTVPLDLAQPQAQNATGHDQSAVQRLRSGLRWDSPELLQRYHAMLKVALPTIAYYGAFHINVASVLDARWLDTPWRRVHTSGGDESSADAAAAAALTAAMPDEFDEFESFLAGARQSIASLTTSSMSMGVTLSYTGAAYALRHNAPWLRRVQQTVHNTPLVYAAASGARPTGTLQAAPPASPLFDVPSMLGQLLPPRMCLALLQVGHPSTPGVHRAGGAGGAATAAQRPLQSDSQADVWASKQAQFIADVFSAARASQSHMPGRLRLIGGGHLVDRPPQACVLEVSAECAPCDAAQQQAVQRMAAQRCSSGLLRADASRKPGWAAWLTGAAQLQLAGSTGGGGRENHDPWLHTNE